MFLASRNSGVISLAVFDLWKVRGTRQGRMETITEDEG